jgi:hypothetical protein
LIDRGGAEVDVGRRGADRLGRLLEVVVGNFPAGIDRIAIEGVVEGIGSMGAGGRRWTDLGERAGLGRGVDRRLLDRGGISQAAVDEVAGIAVEELLHAAGDDEEGDKGDDLPAAEWTTVGHGLDSFTNGNEDAREGTKGRDSLSTGLH